MKKTTLTTINHYIRVELGLTCDEYVMADAIHRHNKDYPIKVMLYEDYRLACGFTGAEVDTLLRSLKTMGIIQKSVSGRPEVTGRWLQCFKVDTEAEFNDFWMLGPQGGKALAKKQYARCREIATKEELFDGYAKYIKWAKAIDRSLKDTCTWLNPANRCWEDNYEIPKNTLESAPMIEGSFFKR